MLRCRAQKQRAQGAWAQITDHRSLVTAVITDQHHRSQITDDHDRLMITDHRSQITDHRSQTLVITDHRSQITGQITGDRHYRSQHLSRSPDSSDDLHLSVFTDDRFTAFIYLLAARDRLTAFIAFRYLFIYCDDRHLQFTAFTHLHVTFMYLQHLSDDR
jgi:hypothetical protein